MLELILLLGLLFVLALVLMLHIMTTSQNEEIREFSQTDPNPDAHPWFIVVELILIFNAIYLSQYL